ncbi:hypothetical protein V2S66_13285 [Streptomyces sp. V4-01]|uniref:Cellulose synthase n=1 Tax=Actinacidiphila polyblastidii TaxID=3110430 RepID=A0ABU7PAV7_9ACTN|nr:hypothetical protein [Streptomyces sp. V4-01]
MLTTTLCAALSAAGLALAFLTAYRRRFLRATRIAAAALLPVGLALAGLVTLARRISTAVGDWAADLVFKPTVWTGFVVLGCSAALYGVSRLFAGRGRGRAPEARTAGPAGVAGTPKAQELSGGRGASAGGGKRGSRDSGLSDFADVEEILKRRGI